MTDIHALIVRAEFELTHSVREGDTDNKLIPELREWLKNNPSDPVAAERERCAKLCETTAMQTGWVGSEKTKRYSTYVAGEPAGGLGNTHEGMGYAALIREGTK